MLVSILTGAATTVIVGLLTREIVFLSDPTPEELAKAAASTTPIGFFLCLLVGVVTGLVAFYARRRFSTRA